MTQATPNRSLASSWTALVGWLLTASLLVSNAPLFVCLPLTDDARMYDVQVRVAKQGGVLYRDVVEPNLPGVHFIHWLVRTIFGWSSEALRSADLVIFCGLVGLIATLLRSGQLGATAMAWTAFACFLFYFSSTEWIHCQRDMWLLALGLAAFSLRLKHLERLRSETVTRNSILVWSFFEGLVWGAAVWIKPHVAIPAAVVWIIGAGLTNRRRVWLLDGIGLLLGGLSAGTIGVGLLVASGTWPHLWETLTVLNPVYVQAGRMHWTGERFYLMLIRFLPWPLVHVIAIPFAAWRTLALLRSIVQRHKTSAEPVATIALASPLYLAWLAQVFFLQHLFDYVYAPTFILAILVFAVEQRCLPRWLARATCIGGLLLALSLTANIHPDRPDNQPLAVAPAIRPARLATWPMCLREGSSSAVRDRLMMTVTPKWSDVDAVVDYLSQREVKGHDVLVFSPDLLDVYFRLDLKPPSKFVYVEQLLYFFPRSKFEPFKQDMITHHVRFVVVDLATLLAPKDARQIDLHQPLVPPKLNTRVRNQFPWSQPIVFRSGSLLVYEVIEPIGEPTAAPSAKESRRK